MDLDLLRTFIEVEKTRHFARAADNLFVSQAAVSARIAQLEGVLGQPLFTRSRNNIQLTSTGQQLLPYANSMLETWSQALMETRHSDESGPLLRLACLPSLREIFLDGWLPELLAAKRNWLLQISSGNTREMIDYIRQGTVEIGLLYEPPRASDLWVEPLTRFDLIMVSTLARQAIAGLGGYIFVDWGSSFSAEHNANLSALSPPGLRLDSPSLAMNILERRGGCAYLARPMVEHALRQKKLHLVADAPSINREVYAVGKRDPDANTEALLASLQALTGSS